MIITEERRSVESVGTQRTAQAKIKASSKLFNFFASGIYSNKPRAIVRELAANAVDSHIMAGKADVPVQIWLPTLLDPTFRVKDEGIGMSEDFIFERYLVYAEGSTKDDSDDVIGGFGVGKAAVFSYIDQFTLISTHDGLKSVYAVYVGEDGIPAVTMLGQQPTTDGNGVTVEFPVKPDDFSTFEEAAFEALRYFEPLPDIRNATEGSFNPPSYVAKGKTWGMRPSEGPLQIIMGGVMYPVSVDNLTYKFNSNDAAYKLLKYGIDLRLPIGTCSIALSREALSYDDRTVEAIRSACEAMIAEVQESFSTIFDHIDSAWEARVALHKEVGGSSYYRSARGEFLAEHAVWKGQSFGVTMEWPKLVTTKPVDGATFEVSGYAYWDIQNSDGRRGRRGRVKAVGNAQWTSPDKFGFRPADFQHLIIVDEERKAIRKIKEFAEECDERCLVIRQWEGEAVTTEQIIEAFGNPDPSRVILTSELPEPIVERSYTKNKDRPKVRMFTWDGTSHSSWRNGYVESLNPGPYGKLGVVEIPYVDQPQTGILVVMEAFVPPAADLRRKVESGLLSWDELLFVNVGDAKKLKGFRSYDKAFDERLKAALAEYPDLPKRLALYHTSELSNLFRLFRSNPGVDFSSRKPLGQIFNLYKRYVEPLTTAQLLLAPFVTAKLPSGVKPEQLIEKFNTKQPKARRLLELLPDYRPLDEEDLKLFQENL